MHILPLTPQYCLGHRRNYLNAARTEITCSSYVSAHVSSAPLSYVSAHVSLSHLSNGSYQDSLAICQMVAIKSLSTPVSNGS